VEELDAQKEQLQAQNEQLRAAQRELEVSRSRYAELYDSAPVGYVCLDRKGLMLELNLTTARMLGAERFRLVGHPFQLYLAKPDVKKFLGHLSHGKRSGKPVRAELLLAARCGPPRWVQAVTLAVADPEHLKTVFHTSLMDVTERKRAEQALLGSEEQYRLLFERNPHPMWISDRATLGFMAVNDTAIRNYGYTRQEFLAMTLKDLRASRGGAGRWPDHEEGPAGGRGALPAFVGLWMHRRKDGALIEVEITRSAVVFEGKDAWLILAHDVTARRRAEAAFRESEARFRATFENAAAGMCTTDADGRFLQVNPVFCGFLGFTQPELLKLTMADVTHPDFLEDTLRQWKDARTGACDVIHCENKFRRKDEAAAWGHVTAVFQFDDQRRPRYSVAIIQDITDRKRADEKLKEYAELQNRLSRQLFEVQETERGHIARELHDQLGQLLTGLKLSLRTSADHPSGNIKADLERAEALVGDLTTRVRDLALDLRPSLLDDLGLLPALLWHFDRFTEQTRVRVAFQHAGIDRKRFGPQVETAAYRIVQEGLNNVARHAGVDDATVRVWSGGGRMQIQVEDHGNGFEPAAALGGSRSRGLIGMRERANLLGGELTVDSAMGSGTRLTADLVFGEVEREEVYESNDCPR